jgi:chaperonin GroEL
VAKELQFDAQARESIKAGVKKLEKAVAKTIGPKGRNVVLGRRMGNPVVTNDGVTIAKEIEVKDIFENIGVQLVKEAAIKTNDVAGDGTTTATILAKAIYEQGLGHIQSKASPMYLKRGIAKAVNAVVVELKHLSKDVENNEDVAQVASISANNDTEIGKLIAEGMQHVGKSGVVTIEQSPNAETTVDVTEGFQFDNGAMSPFFVNDEDTLEVVFNKNILIFVVDQKIENVKDILELLEQAATSKRPLVIIAADLSPEVLSTLVLSKLKNQFAVVAVKGPGFGDKRSENMKDIAALTGATVISEMGVKLTEANLSHLGTAKKVQVGKENTTIVSGGGKQEDVEKRISIINKEMGNTTSDYEKETYQQRLARLEGVAAVLNVGATTEVELKEKKMRVEDALNATRAAIDEGIVPGGGVALLRARKVIKELGLSGDEKKGADIVFEALSAPISKIAENAGVGGEVVVNETEKRNGAEGFNAATNTYENLIDAGVIDPTKVTRSALENAASVAAMMLTTDCIVVDEEEENPPQMGMPQMGM